MATRTLNIELEEGDAVVVVCRNGMRGLCVCAPEDPNSEVPDSIHVASGIIVMLHDEATERKLIALSKMAVASANTNGASDNPPVHLDPSLN